MQVDLSRVKKCDVWGKLRSAQHILGEPLQPPTTRSIADVLQPAGSVLNLLKSRYKAAGSGGGHSGSDNESRVVSGGRGVRRRRALLVGGLALQMGRARRRLSQQAQQAESASMGRRKGPEQPRVPRGG